LIIRIPYSQYNSLSEFSEHIVSDSITSDDGKVLSNLHGLAQLGVILEVFEKEGVEALVLKGFATALQIYADPFRRVMNDIDLLVRPRDYERAIRLVGGLDYKLTAKYTDVATLEPTRGKSVEIHTHPGHTYSTARKPNTTSQTVYGRV